MTTLTLTSVTRVPPIEDENERSEQILDVSDASSLSSQRLVRVFKLNGISFSQAKTNITKPIYIFMSHCVCDCLLTIAVIVQLSTI